LITCLSLFLSALRSALSSGSISDTDVILAPHTVRWYGDLLGRFAEWVGENERIADLNAETIKDYARSVRDRDLSKFALDTER